MEDWSRQYPKFTYQIKDTETTVEVWFDNPASYSVFRMTYQPRYRSVSIYKMEFIDDQVYRAATA